MLFLCLGRKEILASVFSGFLLPFHLFLQLFVHFFIHSFACQSFDSGPVLRNESPSLPSWRSRTSKGLCFNKLDADFKNMGGHSRAEFALPGVALRSQGGLHRSSDLSWVLKDE